VGHSVQEHVTCRSHAPPPPSHSCSPPVTPCPSCSPPVTPCPSCSSPVTSNQTVTVPGRSRMNTYVLMIYAPVKLVNAQMSPCLCLPPFPASCYTSDVLNLPPSRSILLDLLIPVVLPLPQPFSPSRPLSLPVRPGSTLSPSPLPLLFLPSSSPMLRWGSPSKSQSFIACIK
jgi:hypothetical protein